MKNAAATVTTSSAANKSSVRRRIALATWDCSDNGWPNDLISYQGPGCRNPTSSEAGKRRQAGDVTLRSIFWSSAVPIFVNGEKAVTDHAIRPHFRRRDRRPNAGLLACGGRLQADTDRACATHSPRRLCDR